MAERTVRTRHMSVEEFHRFEDESLAKHEYVAGQVYAMTGVTARHAQIVGNLYFRLRSAIPGGPCRAYMTDLRVQVGRDAVYYPDLLVVCTPHDEETHVIHDPCMVAEVTSRSTAARDRREKLAAYKRLPSLRAYLVVDQTRRRVQRHWLADDGQWWSEELVGEGEVPVPCPEAVVTLAEIYEGVRAGLGVREPEPDSGWDSELEPELES